MTEQKTNEADEATDARRVVGIGAMMRLRTPEERKLITTKGQETRRRRREEENVRRQNDISYADGLSEKIEALEAKLARLERMDAMHAVSAALTGKTLLRWDEISEAAQPWERSTGVYFLLHRGEVVYVGQAVHVYSRIAQHTNKKFDSYAFVPCAKEMLDRLESLYIHCLRPRLNGDKRGGEKCAPIPLEYLIGKSRRMGGARA